MPANHIMTLYRAGQLHSGTTGKIVDTKAQAKAILISYLKKEGRVN